MEIHLGIEIVESAGLFQVVCLPPNSDARGWDCIWIPCSKVIDYSSHEVPLSTSLEILNCHKSPLIRFILGSHHDQRQLKSFIHVKDLIRKLLVILGHWVPGSSHDMAPGTASFRCSKNALKQKKSMGDTRAQKHCTEEQ